MDQKTFLEYVADLCKTKKLDNADFVKKLLSCGDPGTNNATVCSWHCFFYFKSVTITFVM